MRYESFGVQRKGPDDWRQSQGSTVTSKDRLAEETYFTTVPGSVEKVEQFLFSSIDAIHFLAKRGHTHNDIKSTNFLVQVRVSRTIFPHTFRPKMFGIHEIVYWQRRSKILFVRFWSDWQANWRNTDFRISWSIRWDYFWKNWCVLPWNNLVFHPYAKCRRLSKVLILAHQWRKVGLTRLSTNLSMGTSTEPCWSNTGSLFFNFETISGKPYKERF